ncbi:hypothetical protein D915_004629 [Fasciola hepatica]|uniref:Uncharacterized protein n=1 Tax=Fasciola hepatica TaxID=6192 RepID=A0A4E0R8D5_FASHE|nr:hypothetical protein D915_004629 [Fasciola hepatica]
MGLHFVHLLHSTLCSLWLVVLHPSDHFSQFFSPSFQLAVPLLIVVIVLHCLFCIGLLVTFFHGSGSIPSVAGPAPAPVAPVDVPGIKPLVKPVNMLSKRSV